MEPNWKDISVEYKDRLIACFTSTYIQYTNCAPAMPTEESQKNLAELAKAYGALLKLMKENY